MLCNSLLTVEHILISYIDFLPVKTVSHITYTVLEGTLNTAQSNPILVSTLISFAEISIQLLITKISSIIVILNA